jgi:hypothetical protein
MAHPISLIPALLAAFVGAQAEPEDRHQDLIHSDVPLWTHEQGNLWPRAIGDADSFGCQTRIRFGDWRYDEAGVADEPTWYRFSNYGVFHCFMWVRDARERRDLAGREPDGSFFVELGTARGREGLVELWALQRGSRPGSNYLLLSRAAGTGAISEFEMLQRECPRDRLREGPPLSVLITSYCAINGPRELTQLARRMAQLPALGRLTFVAAAEEEDD